MSKELLNIVNESGKVIGVDTRENIHRKGLLHKEVHIWFVSPSGEIIFQHRAKNKDTFPNLLDATVGGHVEIGNDYITTAIKEIYEETGIHIKEVDLHSIKVIKSSSKDLVTGRTNNVLRAVFAYKFDGSLDLLKQESGEGAGFEAFSLERLRNLSKSERERFIPKVIDETHMALFENMINRFQTRLSRHSTSSWQAR